MLESTAVIRCSMESDPEGLQSWVAEVIAA